MRKHIYDDNAVVKEDEAFGEFINEIADLAYDQGVLIKELEFIDGMKPYDPTDD